MHTGEGGTYTQPPLQCHDVQHFYYLYKYCNYFQLPIKDVDVARMLDAERARNFKYITPAEKGSKDSYQAPI